MKTLTCMLVFLATGFAYGQVNTDNSRTSTRSDGRTIPKPASGSSSSFDRTQGQHNFSISNPQDNQANVDLVTEALNQLMPFLDPSSENIKWNGVTWNLNDQRFFKARFEKYLNSPEGLLKSEQKYHAMMNHVQKLLLHKRGSGEHLDEAFRYLTRAAYHPTDAGLSDALVAAIYSVWATQGNQRRLAIANRNLQKAEQTEGSHMLMTAGSGSMRKSPSKNRAGKISRPSQEKNSDSKESVEEKNDTTPDTIIAEYDPRQTKRDVRMLQHMTRIAEIRAKVEANKANSALSRQRAQIEFQSLIMHYFFQRRFQHTLVGISFYRLVFGDQGRTELQLDGEARNLFAGQTGLPPTLSTVETVARDAIQSVKEGAEAFDYLLKQNELQGASMRLAETFWVGEHMPEPRAIPREKKRQVLKFTQHYFKLLSALDMKDFTLAEELVNTLGETALDFDASKPMAAIETAKVISSMHLAQAKNAALRGETLVVQEALQIATELWPRNPELKEVSKLIFNSGDIQQQALIDFDRLIAQKNYRQIFEDRARYMASVFLYPDRQEQLQKVLENIQTIESAILRAQEMAKQDLYPGAWEALELAFATYASDNILNQARADMTTKSSEFVKALRQAEEFEEEENIGSSLAWYLKAQNLYPASHFAQEGIKRLSVLIMPNPSKDDDEAAESEDEVDEADDEVDEADELE